AVLRGVVAQQLVPTVDGRRVAAREILINTPAVANLIRENNIAQLPSVIQTGAKQGMIPMDKAIEALYKEELIDKETAEKRSGRQRRI
ncbi:MAG: type IV pili twitching motility protein PilT, partial [Candidatus Magasanikbacteria bacterium CG10_big_fil_rev_8_21_14_0_10_43_6]